MSHRWSSVPPFSPCNQLYQVPRESSTSHPDGTTTVPDEPSIGAVTEFLARELETPVLDELYPYLWLVARQSSDHIDPLHVQVINGRRIVIAEDPKLHLVWFYDVIYIKPIPRCLLNYEFWERFLCDSPDQVPDEGEGPMPSLHHLKSALGYLRTYSYLIRHRSDLRLAVDAHLLPEDVDWVPFSRFIALFRTLVDDEVSQRYHYGQLRLTRLNFAVRILRPQSSPDNWNYHKRSFQTPQYVEGMVAPLVLWFGSLTIILGAMQVTLASPEVLGMAAQARIAFGKASWLFSVMVILGIGAIWLSLFGGVATHLMMQFAYALKTKARKERAKRKTNA